MSGLPFAQPLASAGRAGRPDWSWAGTGTDILYDRRTGNGWAGVSYYHLFRATLDRSRGDISNEVALTFGASGNPQQHNGCGAFSPDGTWIVYCVERATLLDAASQSPAEPGNGWRNDLWVMSSDGSQRALLWAYDTAGGIGTMHPHFSPDGTKVVWVTLTSGATQQLRATFGTWALQLADVSYPAGGLPTLSNVRVVTIPHAGPNAQFAEAYGFTPDGTGIILATNPSASQGQAAMDICTVPLDGSSLNNLTGTMFTWDEHGRYSPDGTKIAYMSSFLLTLPALGVSTEFWVMNANGSGKFPITGITQPGHRGYIPPDTMIYGAARSAWSPDGTQLLASTVGWDTTTGIVTDNGPLLLISGVLTPGRWANARQGRTRTPVARSAAARVAV